jgi:hypothetical protein
MNTHYDLIALGGGSGGLAAAEPGECTASPSDAHSASR